MAVSLRRQPSPSATRAHDRPSARARARSRSSAVSTSSVSGQASGTRTTESRLTTARTAPAADRAATARRNGAGPLHGHQQLVVAPLVDAQRRVGARRGRRQRHQQRPERGRGERQVAGEDSQQTVVRHRCGRPPHGLGEPAGEPGHGSAAGRVLATPGDGAARGPLRPHAPRPGRRAPPRKDPPAGGPGPADRRRAPGSCPGPTGSNLPPASTITAVRLLPSTAAPEPGPVVVIMCVVSPAAGRWLFHR